MMRITLNKGNYYQKQALEKIVRGKLTPENLDRFKKLASSELNTRIREFFHREVQGPEHLLSLEALNYGLKKLRALESELKRYDPKARFDNGALTFQGLDHNFEMEFGSRVYHFSAGKGETGKNNGDSLVSVLSGEMEIHGVFDGASFCRDDWEASRIAAKMLERAGLFGLIEGQSDLVSLLQGIHEELSSRGLSTTATIALMKPNKLQMAWVGDSHAYLFHNSGDKDILKPLTAPSPGFLGHSDLTGVSHIEKKIEHEYILMLFTDGFDILRDEHMRRDVINMIKRRKDYGFIGFGSTYSHPRLSCNSLSCDSVEGPVDDTSIIIIRQD
jgi:hypothetical protein